MFWCWLCRDSWYLRRPSSSTLQLTPSKTMAKARRWRCDERLGVGAVDDFAVVYHRVAGLQMHRDFIGLVLGAVIGNALRKTQDRGAIVRPDALVMRAGAIAQTAVFLVNRVEGQPNGGDVGRLEVEVEVVLMRRRGGVRSAAAC